MSHGRCPRLVLSSRNLKKIQEVAEILAPRGIDLVSIAAFPQVGEIEETGTTLAENAELKATVAARAIGEWVIGEDSGLMVDALDGRPGVYSARYSGPGATDATNNAKLLVDIRDVPAERRTAAYVCTIALSDPTGNVRARAEGRCRGLIISEARGSNGFGYDPYFLIREYHATFGELSPRVKHQISHRARALTQFVRHLSAVFAGE